MTVSNIARNSDPTNLQRYSRLEITLHNTGSRLVVIDRAKIEIRRVYELPRCATQGDIALSNVYGVLLPVDAKPGDVFTAPLHQQIGDDEADRFGISLSTKRPADAPPALYLFEFRTALVNDSPHSPLPLGRTQVSLPEMPSEGEYYWNETTVKLLSEYETPDHRSARELWADAMPCWRSNTAILRRVLSASAVRSPELDALKEELVTPTFAALE